MDAGVGTLWSIGPEDMEDNFSNPETLTDGAWVVGTEGQKWPRFHPSEADPNSGYRLHPYTVTFNLAAGTVRNYCLRVAYVSIAPRLSALDVDINGHHGRLYLRPAPLGDGDIRVPAGLHTSIYTGGTAEVILPATFMRPGANRLTLTAVDAGDFERVENWEHILRLDRMADASGFIYDSIELTASSDLGAPIARCEFDPTVLYSTGAADALVQHCRLRLSAGRPNSGGQLAVQTDGHSQAVTVPPVELGDLSFDICIPDGAGDVHWTASGDVGGVPAEFSGVSARPRKWTIFVAPHAHTDIGYTHRQWEVAERQAVNIDRALDMIGSADFAFHLDSSWPLEHFAATRSPDKWQRLLDQVARQCFGVAASYVDLLTQFAALEDLIHNGEHTDEVLGERGLHSDFTTVVDVASITWSLPRIWQDQGVRYLVHANNQDRGPFRSFSGLHRVSPYYWEGAAGGRVLVWLSKAYCELRKVCGSPPTLDSGARGMQQWLQDYERPDFLPDAVLMYGQEADNTDLDPQPSAFIERWNDTYAYPRLVICAVSDFFRYVEQRWGDRLTNVRGDGGAYWEDGVLSSIAPTIAVRGSQAALPAAETLESLAVLLGPDSAFPVEEYGEAWRQVLLYDEHTWGSAMSMSDAGSLIQRDQWEIKEHMARSAAQWSARLLHGAAVRHSLRWNADSREVVVYNPHNWAGSGPALVEFARGERPVDPTTGEPVPMRQVGVTETQQQAEIWVDGMPGLSFRRYVLEQEPSQVETALSSPVLENGRYRLEFDVQVGCVRSWRDRRMDRELVDPAGEGLGRFVYAEGGEGTRLTNNRTDLLPGNPHIMPDFDLDHWTAQETDYGQVMYLRGAVPAGELHAEWILPARADWVEVHYTYNKRAVRGREAAYIAFPLALPDAAVLSDSQLGWVNWEEDELPGGAKEWLPLQSAILVRGDGADVLVCSPGIPLFCVGDIVRGRWPRQLNLRGGHLYSYVLNNYWHTNYKAQQDGTISFGYRLMSDDSISLDRAFRAGKSARRPLYAHRMSLQTFRSPEPPYGGAEGTLGHVGPDSIALSTLRPARDGHGWIARLQEIAGRDETAEIRIDETDIVSAWRTDLLGRDIERIDVGADGTVRVPVRPWGLASVRLVTRGREKQMEG